MALTRLLRRPTHAGALGEGTGSGSGHRFRESKRWRRQDDDDAEPRRRACAEQGDEGARRSTWTRRAILTTSQGWNPDEHRPLDVRRPRPQSCRSAKIVRQGEIEMSRSPRSTSAGGRARCIVLDDRPRSGGAREGAASPAREEYDWIDDRHAAVARPAGRSTRSLAATVRDRAGGSAEHLSLRGLVQLENTLAMIRENLNPTGRDRGDPGDDVRRAPLALARGGGDPEGELRRLSC